MFKKKSKKVVETPAESVLNEEIVVENEIKDESTEVEGLPPVSIGKLYSFATPVDLLILITASFCAILNGVAQPVMSLIFSGVIGLFVDYAQGYLTDPEKAKLTLQNEVNWLCLLFVIIGAVTIVTAYGQLSLFMISGERQAVRIRHQYYRSILSQEVGWFDFNQSGDISSRIAGDVNLVQEGISDKIGLFIQYTSTFLAGFVIAFTQGWKLTLVLLSVVPILIACGMFVGKLIAEDSVDGQGAYGQAGSVAEEVLSAIHTVYSFGGQKTELKRYKSKLEIALKKGHRKSIINGLGIGVIFLILFFSYALGMWYGAKLIAEENYTPQEVIAVFFSVLIGATSIGQASPALTALATALGAAAKLFDIIDRKSQINPFLVTDSMKEAQKGLGQLKGKVTFQDVKFNYPSRPDVPILKGVSLNIEPGTTVALVGQSGSGKSTVVSLIERFYDPEQGQILLDNVNIKNVSIKFLREHIGIVGQEPILFATTIKRNILYGLRNDDEIDYNSPEIQKRVEEACKLSNIHEFITTLPQGYDTMVGDKGSSLSGGQKQRIAIARALIKDPRILLLDEATSALDTESEKLVQQALDNAAKNRTTLVIAHRLSTIKDADKIVVFDKGTIVEQGNHDELINLDAVYASLVTAQALRTGNDTEGEKNLTLAKETELKPSLPIKGEVTSDVSSTKVMKLVDDPLSEQDPVKLAAKRREERLAKKPVPILRVLKMVKPWFPLVLLGLIGSLIDGAIFPIYSLILTRMSQAFLDIVTPGLEDIGRADANFWALMFVVLGVISFFVNTARIGAMEYVGESLTYTIRYKSFEALLQQEVAYFDDHDNSVGILAAKLSTEAEQIQGLVSKILGPIFSAISTAAVGLGLAFGSGWKLTLVVLATVPVVAIANIAELKVLTKINRRTKKAYEKVSQIASESIINVRTLAGLTREEVFYQDYVNRVSKAHRSAVDGALKAALAYSIAMGTPFLVNAIAFWYGTTLVVQGEYNFLEMFQVISAVIFTGAALGSTSAQLNTYVKSKVAAIDLFELLDREPTISNSDQVGEKSYQIAGNLNFHNAHFAYPSLSNVPILKGLGLEIVAGMKIALVGSSGSGKSTIIALAQRFYDLTSGSLQVEGTDIKKWNVPHLRSEMSLVGQEPVLFDLTIAQNIAYARSDATVDQIEQAAKMANAHNFIIQQPDGYNTKVGERGGQLSGGQKQRVAIARALIRNPKLLLLDEATSALDSDSEKVVQEALDLASKNRTTITIAHRLSTIQDYDLIMVMREGNVVEKGTHDSLLNLKGYYYNLVNQQQLSSSSL